MSQAEKTQYFDSKWDVFYRRTIALIFLGIIVSCFGTLGYANSFPGDYRFPANSANIQSLISTVAVERNGFAEIDLVRLPNYSRLSTLRGSAYKLEWQNSQCSSTGVSDNAVLTALHCWIGANRSKDMVLSNVSGSRPYRVINAIELPSTDQVVLEFDRMSQDFRPLSFLSVLSKTPQQIMDGSQVIVVCYPAKLSTIEFNKGPLLIHETMVIGVEDQSVIADSALIGGCSGGNITTKEGVVIGVVSKSNDRSKNMFSFSKVGTIVSTISDSLAARIRMLRSSQ